MVLGIAVAVGSGSHNRTVPSRLPLASSTRPSGNAPNATAATGPVCPVSGDPTGAPVPGSPNRTAPSQPPPVASSTRPSGNAPNATAATPPVCPVSGDPTGAPVPG